MPNNNFEHVIHKHSSVVTNGNPKLPTTSQIEYGEIAVNYADGSETISLKNSNNEIVTFSTDEAIKKIINEDAYVISNSLNDLNSRVGYAESNISDLRTSVSGKQNTLVSGSNIKTINNQSLLGNGNINIQGTGGGEANVIESVKVNGTALVPDSNKAVNISSIPSSIVSQDATHRFVSDTEKSTWNGKQDALSNASVLSGINSSDISNWNSKTDNVGTITGITMNGASKGTSGVVNLGTVLTSHQDITGKADKSDAIGSLSLSMNSTNYQITLSGTKVDGTAFTVSNVIDLPLESVVVSGSYNDTTKKVVLTLKSGSTVEFSIADLINGLQSEITSTNKLSADLISDGTTNKTVTATEKSTWNGKQDALSNATVLSGITSTKVSNWDSAATNSHTHSNKTVLDGISSTDVSNWNSKTDNVGTVTGVKMNGTTNNPTSGVVDLGTVVTSETTLSKGTTSGSGNAVTDISVSGHQITLTKGSTFLTSHQSIKTINNTSLVGTGDLTINGLPTVTSSDNGKILMVVDGAWALVSPTMIYTGSGTPSSAQGNDGDIYLQTN